MEPILTPDRYKAIWEESATLKVADFNLDEIIAPHVLEERILRSRHFAERISDLVTEVRQALQAAQQRLNNRKKAYRRKRDELLVNDKTIYLLKPVSRVEAEVNNRLRDDVDLLDDLELEVSGLKILLVDLTDRRSDLATSGTNFRTAKDSMIQRMQMEGPSNRAPIYTKSGMAVVEAEKPVIKPPSKATATPEDDEDLEFSFDEDPTPVKKTETSLVLPDSGAAALSDFPDPETEDDIPDWDPNWKPTAVQTEDLSDILAGI